MRIVLLVALFATACASATPRDTTNQPDGEMVFYIVKANIKPGQLEAFTAANRATLAFISEHEPRYASYSFLNEDQTSVTWINAFDGPAAMARHFELAPEIEALGALMQTIEITDRQVFGALTPALATKLQGVGGVLVGASAGTRDRRISTAR